MDLVIISILLIRFFLSILTTLNSVTMDFTYNKNSKKIFDTSNVNQNFQKSGIYNNGLVGGNSSGGTPLFNNYNIGSVDCKDEKYIIEFILGFGCKGNFNNLKNFRKFGSNFENKAKDSGCKISHKFVEKTRNLYLKEVKFTITCPKSFTDLSNMFCCSNINYIKFTENTDLSNVKNISNMFNSCKLLEYVKGISNWNTNNVINMIYKIGKCYLFN